MALDTLNAIGAFAILNQRPIDPQQKVLGVTGAALLPGILGLAVPLIIAQKTDQPAQEQGLVAVPDLLTGKSQAEASSELKQLQLNANVTAATSLDSEKDIVIKQDPLPHSLVDPGTSVLITVGSGVAVPKQDDTDDAVVPDLSPQDQKTSAIILEHFHLKQGKVEEQASADDKKGKIIEQDPKAGSIVKRGSEVSVKVGSGTQPQGAQRSKP